jgi:hypothetical protein
MRAYVLVILKPGPNKMAEGQARSTMFKGHFANMGKLAGERKLVLAGPLDGKEGRRGISKPCAASLKPARAWAPVQYVRSLG